MPDIKHIFVLMMENHSFDHIFGFSNIIGRDASSGKPTVINGLKGTEINTYNGVIYKVQKGADDCTPNDPGHEFTDTLEQLCGQGASYSPGGPYPTIDNSGFVSNYATSQTEGTLPSNDYGEIMKCYDTAIQLPVIYQLATEFAICDNWFSSLPGPTCPNRFFVHGASSGGLDHSPTNEEMLLWQTLQGFRFPNGSIFEHLDNNQVHWRLYNDDQKCFLGGQIPMVSALHGIRHIDVHSFSDFADDLQNDYQAKFTFIEPNYGDVLNSTFKGGSSQHPMDDITSGEQLIKETYQAIRNSSVWSKSMLIITYDEHGGFYDHVSPPAAHAPDDGSGREYNNGFDFRQFGVRVPAVVVSPLIPKNTIDHTLYDHTSILKTVEDLNNINPLTQRDGKANNLLSLFTLAEVRTDCPVELNVPVTTKTFVKHIASIEDTNKLDQLPLPKSGTLLNVLGITLKTELQLSHGSEEEQKEIIENYKTIKTRRDAKEYVNKVMTKLNTARMIRKAADTEKL